jgi:hypothetical protein
MVHKPIVVSLLVAAVVGLALTSCGVRTAEPGAPPIRASAHNDPALTEAAASVQPLLEQSFANSFAGLELQHDIPMMTIYRRPDPQLDSEVTKKIPNVRLAFRDAKYSLTEMKAAVRLLMDDSTYWRSQGMTIDIAAPAVDGSGLHVTTSTDSSGLVAALNARYPTMSFTVQTGDVVVPPVYTGPPPIMSRPPDAIPKSQGPLETR